MTSGPAPSTRRLNVLWLQSGGCGGCTMSLLCARTGDLPATLRDAGVDLLWHPALSEESGAEALEVLRACADGRTRLDVLCLEGAVLRGPEGTGRFHLLAGTGEPMMAWVSRLAVRARHVVVAHQLAQQCGHPFLFQRTVVVHVDRLPRLTCRYLERRCFDTPDNRAIKAVLVEVL